MNTARWLTLLLLIACRGDSKPSAGSASSPTPAPRESSGDPNFVRVDRDQLAALCLARHLPPSSWPSDYGALLLADGSRVPWLTVWVDEQYASALDEKPVLAKEWLSRATAAIADDALDGWTATGATARPRTR